MSHTKFHRCIIVQMNTHGHDGGLKELAKMTGINYRTLWSRAQRPREIKMFEFFSIADELNLTNGEQQELIAAIKEG